MTINTRWVGLCAAALLACSSASPQDDRCSGGSCDQARAQAFGSTDGDGAAASAEPPSQAGDFGNAMQPTTPVAQTPPPPPDTMMPIAGASGDCEEGMFCVPGGPDGGCGQITFDAEVEVTVTRNPGNVFLVFDRYFSMTEMWNGQARWSAAGEAIQNALQPLGEDLGQAGAVFFPTANADSPPVCIDPTGIACIFVPLTVEALSCEVDGADPAQIAFMPGDQFLGTFSNGPPYAPVPNGATPLMEGLQEAQRLLSGATLEGNTAVVVITDGEPNCAWNAGTATQIVTEWYNQGIDTHVIGLPGIMGGNVLNQLAQAGGTGQYITPADPQALQDKLQAIVSETVSMSMGFNSCSIALSPPATETEKLLMVVEEPGVAEKQQVPKDFGWSVSPAGDQVEITGALCDEAKGGRFTSITFEYGCPDVDPPPPIPPLQ